MYTYTRIHLINISITIDGKLLRRMGLDFTQTNKQTNRSFPSAGSDTSLLMGSRVWEEEFPEFMGQSFVGRGGGSWPNRSKHAFEVPIGNVLVLRLRREHKKDDVWHVGFRMFQTSVENAACQTSQTTTKANLFASAFPCHTSPVLHFQTWRIATENNPKVSKLPDSNILHIN